MKRSITTYLLCLICFGAIAQSKIGYVQLDSIYNRMPETIDLNTRINYIQDSLFVIIDKKQQYFTKLYSYCGYNPGRKYTQAEIDKSQKTLDSLQNDFQTTTNAFIDYIVKEESKLLLPIEEKAIKAIADVAKENGYSYVFDSISGPLAFDYDNITPLVLERLGIK